jgi:tRNA pseudouridine38-40 synthase
LPYPFPHEKLASAINWHLPKDIRVVKAYQVPGDFHPQTWSKGKIYRYFIYNRNQPTALGRQYCWHIPKALDLTAMNKAAAHCLGRQNFASFQSARSDLEDTVRTVRHLYCHSQDSKVSITCVGDGFLHNMVRIIVGTLVEVGLGRQHPDQVKLTIAARNRRAAGPTAPAKGLFLERVLYRPSLDSYSRL